MTKTLTITETATNTVTTMKPGKADSYFAGNLRDRLAREHAERIGGHLVGTSRTTVEVHAGPAPVTAAEIVAAFAVAPVATYSASR